MEVTAGLIFLGFCLVVSAFLLVSYRLYIAKSELVVKVFHYLLIIAFWITFSTIAISIGYRIDSRHSESYSRGYKSVSEIWGGSIVQSPPSLTFESTVKEQYENKKTGEMMDKTVLVEKGLGFASQDLKLSMRKNIRKKGLLLFPGYELDFYGKFVIKNFLTKKNRIHFRMELPNYAGNIMNVQILLNGKEYKEDTNLADGIDWSGEMEPLEEKEISIFYKAQGSKSFQYSLGVQAIEMKRLSVILESDFSNFNIPDNAMAPSTSNSDSETIKIEWKGENIITGQNLSVNFEIEGNYGAMASKLFYYSPISMALFLSLLLLLLIPRGVKLHPMQYLFVIISFFIFYPLGSYLISYFNVILGILLSLAASTLILLQYTYAIKKGSVLIQSSMISAVIFQWLFSIAFFFPEHTGFIITISTIGSFVFLSRATAEIDWENKF
jgi:hypothetical protein